MSKKKGLGMLALVAGAVMLLGIAGCDITEGQAKVIAQNAGLYSAVGWIALDNPSGVVIESIQDILVVIETNAAGVEGGATYTEVLFPILTTYIDEKVALQYRPVCKAGAIAFLGGIDMLFAARPEWQEDQDLAISIVDAFILGAKNGLGMKEDHPVMIQARANVQARAKVYTP